MRALHDCLEGRTANNSPAFLAASRERRPIRWSMTRGYENHALRASSSFNHSSSFKKVKQ
jgi:hypothetical protein